MVRTSSAHGSRSRLRRRFHISRRGIRVFQLASARHLAVFVMGIFAVRIFAVKVLAVNIDDQPVRIRQQEGFVVREIIDLEHHSRPAGLKLRHADLLQESVIHVEALAHQR